MPQLEIVLLGSPRVYLDDRRVEIRLHKAIALLAYLAVTGRAHSREALATLLWPDADQSTALGRLRRTLYRVGQDVGSDVVLASRTMAELNLEVALRLDTEQFQQLLDGCLADAGSRPAPDTGCVSRLTEAVGLYADDFMAGFTLPDSPPFDEWQFFEADGLRRAFGRALGRLVDIHQAEGAWERAIGYARRRLALDPLEEAVHRRLMELYARAGRQGAAIRQYRECERLLQEELGMAPGEETMALHEAIKSRQIPAINSQATAPELGHEIRHGAGMQGPAIAEGTFPGSDLRPLPAALETRPYVPVRGKKVDAPEQPGNLPAAVQPFIGRSGDLEEVRALLADDPHCRLLVITGPGGIGKTRLALEAARRTRHIFSDGAYLVRLGPLPSADHLLPALAKEIGLRLSAGAAIKEQLLGYLSGKRMLLLLDNFDHLMPGARLVAEILEAAPEVKILVTSRERLNLSSESVYALGGMSYPRDGACRDALDHGAVQLLIHLGRLARPHLDFGPDDVCHASRICRLVGGTPLALVLAAGWLEMLSFQEIADEIAHNLDFLASSLTDLPERQQSVRAAFEYSWKHLSGADRQAFMRLAVFEDGFTRQAAQRVAGVQPRTLRRLIDKSLVSVRDAARYEIHELLCQYAAQQLEASGEADAVRERHGEHYLSMMAQREADLKGRRQIPALDEIEQDLANIRAAWAWAARQKKEASLGRSAESLYLFFSFRGCFQEGAELFAAAREQLMPCPEDEPTLGCSRLSARLAWLQLTNPARPGGIQDDLAGHLALAREHGDRAEVAFSLLQLGCYHLLAEHEPDRAIGFLEQSLEHYRNLGDRFYMAVVLHWLGASRGTTTSPENLMHWMEQSLALARETGNEVMVPYNLRALAMGAICLGDYDAAAAYCHEALAIDAKIGASFGLAESRALLGLTHFLQGDLDRSRDLVAEGLELARQVGHPATVAHSLAVQSLLASLGGTPTMGRQMADESLSMHSTSLGIILARWGLAIAHFELEEYDVAWGHLREGLKQADLFALPATKAWLLPVAPLILSQEGRSVLAVELLPLVLDPSMQVSGWAERWPRFAALPDRLRAELGSAQFDAAWERGRSLEIEATAASILDGDLAVQGSDA